MARSNLYIVCAALFPLAFAAFAVGFGCPVWIAFPKTNVGLWQDCFTVFENCTTLEFASSNWMAGVRGVEIFSAVMLSIALTQLIYENACTTFRARALGERIATGGFCILTGMGGLAGIIVFVVKQDDVVTGDISWGWAFILLAAGSGLLIVIGVGFLIHGLCYEKRKRDKGKANGAAMNGRAGPYAHDENYELPNYSMRAFDQMARPPPKDNLPGYAVYNGPQRNSIALGGGGVGPSMFSDPERERYLQYGSAAVLPPLSNPRYSPQLRPQTSIKQQQYYSVADDRLMDPGFDLSEGYQPARRSVRPPVAENPYSTRMALQEDLYSRGGVNSRIPRPFTHDSHFRGAPF